MSSSPSQSGSPKTWLPSTILRQLLNISKDGNTAISAGNLFQCSSHCSMNIRKTLVHHEVDRPLVERGGRISSLEVLKSPRHSATCFNWSYSEQRIRPDDLQRSLPTQILLGFSFINSVYKPKLAFRTQSNRTAKNITVIYFITDLFWLNTMQTNKVNLDFLFWSV